MGRCGGQSTRYISSKVRGLWFGAIPGEFKCGLASDTCAAFGGLLVFYANFHRMKRPIFPLPPQDHPQVSDLIAQHGSRFRSRLGRVADKERRHLAERKMGGEEVFYLISEKVLAR